MKIGGEIMSSFYASLGPAVSSSSWPSTVRLFVRKPVSRRVRVDPILRNPDEVGER